MRRRILVIFAAIAMVVLSSCSKISQIEVKSCSVASVSLSGLRGVVGQLLLEVDNPALQFTLEDIEGVLYYKGEEYVNYNADPVTINARTTAVYPLDCKASLSPNVSLLQLMSLARQFDLADFTTDIHAKVRLKSGAAKGFTFKDIPIKDLLND